MTTHDRKTTVGELVAHLPGRSRIFERLGIDYCCGGKKPLEEACAEKGLDPEAVLRELERGAEEGGAGPETDWSKASLTALIDHILATHHVLLRRELPRLEELCGKVLGAHGERHAELAELRRVFLGLKGELELHMIKEEQMLFPMIKELESSRTRPSFHCGSVANPIRVMEHEHDSAGRALAALRELSRDYRTPEDGCASYRALLEGLLALEKDLHRHISKENNILFPRAAGREASLPEG